MAGRPEDGGRLPQSMFRHQHPVGVVGGDGKDGNPGAGQGISDGCQDADQVVVERALDSQRYPPATMSHPRWDRALLADDRKFVGGAADAPPLTGNRPAGNGVVWRQTAHDQKRANRLQPLSRPLASAGTLHRPSLAREERSSRRSRLRIVPGQAF